MDKELLQLLETGQEQINTIKGLLEELRQHRESLQALELAKRQLELNQQLRELQRSSWIGINSPDFKGILDTLGLAVEANRHRDS